MKQYTPKTFTIPVLTGISEKNISEHLKLYTGYVNSANLILTKLEEYQKDAENNMYVIGELQRRFSFEFNGMRNHEHYFGSLENSPQEIPDGSELKKQIETEYGSFEKWITQFKQLALTRGIGWAVLYWDKETKQLTHGWIDEQHLGQLNNLKPIIMLDMWEHSYVSDYFPSGKKQYIEDFFSNLNWKFVEDKFTENCNKKNSL